MGSCQIETPFRRGVFEAGWSTLRKAENGFIFNGLLISNNGILRNFDSLHLQTNHFHMGSTGFIRRESPAMERHQFV